MFPSPLSHSSSKSHPSLTPRFVSTSSARGPQYVPLSTGAATNSSNTYELGEEDGSTRGGGGAGSAALQARSNATSGIGSQQQMGTDEGGVGSHGSSQGEGVPWQGGQATVPWQAAQATQPENEWGWGGLASSPSGASTPGDGFGSPPDQFYDAQSAGGSQMDSRRTSFSSMRGLGSRSVLSPGSTDGHTPGTGGGSSTPPRP